MSNLFDEEEAIPRGFAAFLAQDKTTTPPIEARVMPIPKTIKQRGFEAFVRNAPTIKDEIIIPTKNELVKGTKELKDSTNAYMQRATDVPEWLIDEAVSNFLRKAGK